MSATPSQGSYVNGTGVWTVGTVTTATPQTLQVQATVVGSGSQTNTATISHSDQFDPNPGNNSASATVTPLQADLQLTKTVSNPTPNVGNTVTFTVTLSNAGPTTATNVTVQDLLPAGLSFVSATPSQGSYVNGTGVWSVGTVTTATPQTLQLQATVVGSSSQTNTATISHSDQLDPNPGNNSASATVTPVSTGADLSISKTAPATVMQGQAITYTITVNNAGPGAAANVTVNDVLPAGETLVSAAPSQGTFSAGVWTVGTVTTGTPQTLTLVATVNAVAGTILTNTATVTSTTTDPNPANNTSSVTTTVGAPAATTTTLTSSLNPSMFGQSVTLTATVSAGTATGSVTFRDGATVLATVPLSGAATAVFTTSSLALGPHSMTATYNGSANFAASTSSVLVQKVGQAATATALASSLNPSEFGKAVTFTATVTSSAGTPAGTVTFNDGGVAIGTAVLAAGIASFTTSSLTVGSHAITASYVGAGNFGPSSSPTLTQAVNTPADSLKLRALQVLVTPTVAQVSGQAISGAIDSAIGEAFNGGGAFIAPSASGVRFNFAADPEAQPANAALRFNDPFTSANGTFASNGRGLGSQSSSPARLDDTFNALGYAAPAKAPPLRVAEPREWLGWAEVRGATLDRWGNLSTVPGATVLYGNQVNLLAGLTRKFAPNFLVGVLGGYETFDYRSDALLGRLKGDGWTVGSYLGWKITQGIRFDAGVAYSGIGYDGTAGTAAGSFAGNRWLVTSGLTGAYSNFGIQIEPSARVYALWEHENAYTDTLGTLQTARDFSTGRASGGVKLAYPLTWSATTILTPYVGVYGDYYFNGDSAGAPAPGAIPFVILDGWSARAIGGLTAKFDNGAQIAVGGERSGIGGNFGLWTYRARASWPFVAQ
ncbi:Ig-like domain repeat protein [Bradyrhizobium sp. AS23.2]|uniref:Ig-like domain repeat protein n=1 Tax=Bradyrhizobium sp. AS23.2 TaxID=1680155 RepID=UPI0024C02C57|nr:Ig-like domain repeat protein [Bradyrhizobium sp. AS23.2]